MPAGDSSCVVDPGSRLRELKLPKAPTPLGAYVEVSQAGSLIFLSGVLPVVNSKLFVTGRLGENVSLEQGREAPRVAAMNALAAAKQHLGDLGRIKKLVKLTVLLTRQKILLITPPLLTTLPICSSNSSAARTVTRG